MNEYNEFMHLTNPYVRDVFLSYLVAGAKRTQPDGYPIIEKEMVAKEPPQEVFQWDCRHKVEKPADTGMSFYCGDDRFTPVLNNPKNYVEKLSEYACVIGMDASPYDNMPLVVQKSQIFNNLAISYYFGKKGLKIIPNVRIGNDDTFGQLDAIPKECLISVGTNGFVRKKRNREIFRDQLSVVMEVLHPTGILVYGSDNDHVFESALKDNVPIYQYDSDTMKCYDEKKQGKPGNEGDDRYEG